MISPEDKNQAERLWRLLMEFQAIPMLPRSVRKRVSFMADETEKKLWAFMGLENDFEHDAP